jgi:hypothetical protein
MSDQTRSDPTSKEDGFYGKKNENPGSQAEAEWIDNLRKEFKRNYQQRKHKTYHESYYFVKIVGGPK